MPKVRVWNDNVFKHSERFRDELIEIPAGKCIEMEYDDAHLFLGQYFPIRKDGAGNQTRESYKMLRIEDGPIPIQKEMSKTKCQSCGEDFETEKLLDAHVSEKHLDQMVDEDEKKKREKALKKMAG